MSFIYKIRITVQFENLCSVRSDVIEHDVIIKCVLYVKIV